MKKSKDLHREAMKLAQEAFIAEINKKEKESLSLYIRAFELEKVAAFYYLDKDIEPTRSVLLRSAASLAKSAGKYIEAIDLIDKALAGNPPDEIITECENLYNQISREISVLLIKELSSIKSEIKQELQSIHTLLNILLIDKMRISKVKEQETSNFNNLYSEFTKLDKSKNVISRYETSLYSTNNALLTYSNSN